MDYGVNFNGDRSLADIKKGAKAGEEAGFNYIWAGENVEFIHPFPVVAAISAATKHVTVGSGIISPQLNRCLHIRRSFEVFREAYGERYVIGIAPGDKSGLIKAGATQKGVLSNIMGCLYYLKSHGFGVYLGASGPRLLEMGGRLADGVLLNYVYPEYIRWAKKRIRRSRYLGAYGPALLLPDEKNGKSILLAAAFVAAGANPVFLRDFELVEKVARIRALLIKKKYSELRKYSGLLLENFTISGTITAVQQRVEELRKQGVDQVIFGSPFSYNLKSITKLGSLLI